MTGPEANDLLVFVEVVDAGSFVAAAHRLGLSRSAPGKALARLEARFGARLLNRTTRALNLTEAGRTLYEHGLTVREALEAADASIARGTGEPRGQLRIAAPDAVGRRLILPAVRRFLDRWPRVQVEMSLSDRVSDIITEGFDLAIRLGVSDPNPGLISRTLRRESLLLCASPAYLDRIPPPTTVEGLSRHELLIHSHGGRQLTWHIEEADGTNMRVAGLTRLRLDNAEALREAALAGMGVALLPEVIVGPDLETRRLTRLLPSAGTGTVQVLAIYPHKRMLDANVRSFIDQLADEL
ncbi:MAG: LysR family transcriptional regulator [Roseovarius sp.]